MIKSVFQKLFAFCALVCVAVSANGSEPTAVSVQLKDGKLVGNAFALINEEKVPQLATVALAKEGKLVHSVVADEDGLFSFSDVAPGEYSLVATAGNYVGTVNVSVEAPATEAPAAVEAPAAPVAMPAPIPVAMSTYAPAAPISMAAPMASYSSASSGGGYVGGGSSGGNRRLRRMLILGGIVGGVVAGTAGSKSPAN